jgi:hypothetical protein
MILTTAAVIVVGHVREELNAAGLVNGPRTVAERFQVTTRDLLSFPPSWDAHTAEAASPSVEAYLATCTNPTDRVLVFAFMPELLYFIERGFAAGYPGFVRGHHAGEAVQRLGVARWRSQSVPYAVAYEIQGDLARSFPILVEELNRRYVPVYRTAPIQDRGALLVFAERGRKAERTYQPFGAPCFAPRRSSG